MTDTAAPNALVFEKSTQSKLSSYQKLKPIEFTSIEHDIEDAVIRVRQIGEGSTLVFIQEFSVNDAWWLDLIPELSQCFRCLIVDLPDLDGDEREKSASIYLVKQIKILESLLLKLCQNKFSIIANDSEETLARLISLSMTEKLESYILVNDCFSILEIGGMCVSVEKNVPRKPTKDMFCLWGEQDPKFSNIKALTNLSRFQGRTFLHTMKRNLVKQRENSSEGESEDFSKNALHNAVGQILEYFWNPDNFLREEDFSVQEFYSM